jgi:hypothetical protein
MLHVNSASVLPPAGCAAVSWFISINPVMIAVIKTPARCRFFLFSKHRPAQLTSEFETSLIGIIDMTLDVKAKFNSRKKCPN